MGAPRCRRPLSLFCSPGPSLCQILKHNEFCFITVLNELEGGRGMTMIKILIKKIPTGKEIFPDLKM